MNEENLCNICGQNKTSCRSSLKAADHMLKAVRNHDLKKVKFLIQKGKSPNIHNKWGRTSLFEAIIEKREDIVKYLLTLPDIDLEQHFRLYDDTILHTAISRGSAEIVRFILSQGFDANLTNSNGETPLHAAVLQNNFELVSMLLYYNADANIMDEDDYTPFLRALYYRCDTNIQKELFKYEYDYNRKINFNDSIVNTLALALWSGSSLIIDLIKNGADVNYYYHGMDKSILATILEAHGPKNFFYAFPLTNLSVLTKCKKSILNSFLECNYMFSKKHWLKALFLILESDVVIELIDHYYTLTNNFSLIGSFVIAFKKKKVSQDTFDRFVDICLCSGVNVEFDDIEIVYRFYSKNNALRSLLNMQIKPKSNWGGRIPHVYRSFPYIFCSFNKNFESFLKQYYKYNRCANLRSKSALSLLELSRNKSIITICKKYDINSSHWYYYILRRLNLPKVIYDYLTFRRLIK